MILTALGCLNGKILFFFQLLAHQDDLRDYHQSQTCDDIHAVAFILEYDVIVSYMYMTNKFVSLVFLIVI